MVTTTLLSAPEHVQQQLSAHRMQLRFEIFSAAWKQARTEFRFDLDEWNSLGFFSFF